ncbi:RagB/SusD family nutrient uptake outer membrane protein [Zobellia alginiliquefaciens]|uniref:RagB/SusD family nutrient uptake outer membrane protein n=1 Tax=Zobellia alginiliquefaciens TaxID=3032586 RepID=UPI0023E3D3B5|nr:RagB/SusD family nutrient uptake outer membrane protein [Zobellia alginiliquefaciens]
MKNILKNITLFTLFSSIAACSLVEPVDENLLGEERLNFDPAFAEGVLLNAYENMVDQFAFTDVATDDAVHNYLSGYRRMATGEWNAQNAFTSRWWQYEHVLYANKFITLIDEVVWKRDEETNALFKERLYGEAVALRALRHFWILQEHGGRGQSGQLLGIPYITEFYEFDADFNTPRLGFEETVTQIIADFDEALEYLPMDYDGDLAKRPSRYNDSDDDKYQFVFGKDQDARINGRIIKAFKAKLYLLAASPAYMNGQGGYYQDAADILAELLNNIGGIGGLDPTGHYNFYEFPIGTRNFPEVLWRGNASAGMTWVESQHFPPSLNGSGQLNPSQNLVEAFPMLDGFPFSESHPDYNATNPFENRDTRLQRYILYNGNDLNGRVININSAGVDGIDQVSQRSTRSGHYLKKLLDQKINISADGSISASEKFNVYVRYTDLFLMLAEAANELGGPDQMVGGMSARNILAAIRARAGIGLENSDAYLSSIASQEDMRNLIRNERRLELCFEGHRLYDLRRWNIFDETPDAIGLQFNGGEYNEFSVEPRLYNANANYAPIPQNEVVRFNLIEQNEGW